jgi:hypothetical protein
VTLVADSECVLISYSCEGVFVPVKREGVEGRPVCCVPRVVCPAAREGAVGCRHHASRGRPTRVFTVSLRLTHFTCGDVVPALGLR